MRAGSTGRRRRRSRDSSTPAATTACFPCSTRPFERRASSRGRRKFSGLPPSHPRPDGVRGRPRRRDRPRAGRTCARRHHAFAAQRHRARVRPLREPRAAAPFGHGSAGRAGNARHSVADVAATGLSPREWAGGAGLSVTSCRRNGSIARGIAHNIDLHWRISDQQSFAWLFSFAELAAAAVPVPALNRHALRLGNAHALLLCLLHRAEQQPLSRRASATGSSGSMTCICSSGRCRRRAGRPFAGWSRPRASAPSLSKVCDVRRAFPVAASRRAYRRAGPQPGSALGGRVPDCRRIAPRMDGIASDSGGRRPTGISRRAGVPVLRVHARAVSGCASEPAPATASATVGRDWGQTTIRRLGDSWGQTTIRPNLDGKGPSSVRLIEPESLREADSANCRSASFTTRRHASPHAHRACWRTCPSDPAPETVVCPRYRCQREGSPRIGGARRP